jgi:rod shape-determining protein MreC
VRNLAVFFYRNATLFLFIILEAISLYLLFLNSNFQREKFISSSNYVAGNMLTTANTIEDYFLLKETNQRLAIENAFLHNQNKNSYRIYNKKIFTVNDTIFKSQYTYINANVVNNSVNRRNNYLTLNVGLNMGIKKFMGVVSSDGMVGITKEVSANFTSVTSVLNKNFRMSAQIKNTGEFGSLYWNGGDYRFITLSDIATSVKVKVGDTVLTTAHSAIFPENIMIGTIHKVYTKPGDNFYTLTVKFSANIKNVTHVYVINNILKDEQQSLEERSQNDN